MRCGTGASSLQCRCSGSLTAPSPARADARADGPTGTISSGGGAAGCSSRSPTTTHAEPTTRVRKQVAGGRGSSRTVDAGVEGQRPAPRHRPGARHQDQRPSGEGDAHQPDPRDHRRHAVRQRLGHARARSAGVAARHHTSGRGAGRARRLRFRPTSPCQALLPSSACRDRMAENSSAKPSIRLPRRDESAVSLL